MNLDTWTLGHMEPHLKTLSNIDAAILCGGLGTRLRPVIGEQQKVMVAVDGQPFLEILIDELAGQGVQRIVLLTGYQAEDLQNYFSKKKNGPQLNFSKENMPLGTGGALKQAKALIQSDPFFLLNGDSYCRVDFSEMLKFHQSQVALCTIALSSVENQDDYGTVVIDGNKRVTAFKEKNVTRDPGPVTRINAGVYCLSQDIFKRLPAVEKFSLETEVFPQLIQDRVYGFDTHNSLTDIGTPERLKTAQSNFTKGIRSADRQRPTEKPEQFRE